MRALVLADAPPHARLADLVRDQRPDVVLTLGDLSRDDLYGLDLVDLPKLGVHGNHDHDCFADLGIEDMHLKTRELGGLVFGGFEGSERYKPGPYQYEQAEALALLADFPPVDVFLAHSPPLGLNDHDQVPHRGLAGISAYLERTSPRYLLHGHTYPETPVERYRQTTIVYTYRWQMVELSA
jgi:Icc-related predicted phosphoesterase